MPRTYATPSSHNNYINRTKEVPINTNRLTTEQIVWISMLADELSKLVKNFKDGDDICSKQVLNVLRQIDKYIKRYPNPQDAAKAMSYTGRINHGRQEAIQRGEGARRKRVVGQFPIHNTEDGDSIAVDLVDRNAIDPATQAADRDECRRAVEQMPTVAAQGVALTAGYGFDQGEAATQMGISRTYLSRTMKKSEREMRDGRNCAA
jgi:DNA-directed RNA polymerase specialized sigma24 family protein